MSVTPPASERPLRILHLTAASEAGGLSRYIHDISLAMHELGHDVRVAGARGAWHPLFEKAPFPWIELPLNRGPLSLWKSIRALRRHLTERPVDILHTHYRRSMLVARRLQTSPRHPPALYTVHLSDIRLKWPSRLWADFGDHTHAASEDARTWAINKAHIPADRVTVVPHGLHVDRWPLADASSKRAARQRYDLSPEDRVACYVGRLDYPKNEQWLLDVVEKARNTLPNLKLLIAGSGPGLEGMAQRVANAGLEKRVLLLGELENPLPVYEAADAFLLPSLREGFSFGCAEALCVGVPVLRTRTAGSHELIIENVTGRSCPIEHDTFVSAAIDFLRDGEALARMGAAGATHVRQNLTFDRQLAGTLALYRRLAGRPVEQADSTRRTAAAETGA